MLSFFVLAALRVLFTVPTELRANRIFRMTEIDDKAVYLNGSRKAMWLLGALPIAVVTLPVYAAWWGPAPALQHTAFWLLMSGLPDGASAVPLSQDAVRLQLRAGQGEREVPVAGPHALALTAYAWWTARLELWLLSEPVRWSIACALLIACLGACITLRRDRLASSTPLTYEEEVEEAIQVLGVMRT